MDALLFIAIAAAVFYVIYRSKTPSDSSWQRKDGTFTIQGHVVGDSTFSADVVGESHYQGNIEHAAGGRNHDSAHVVTKAVLYLEDENPHDRNAVRVLIEGRTAGYLDRAAAKAWRRKLSAGGFPIGHYTVDALIVGGWDRGEDDQGHFGVKLDVPALSTVSMLDT